MIVNNLKFVHDKNSNQTSGSFVSIKMCLDYFIFMANGENVNRVSVRFCKRYVRCANIILRNYN